MLLALSNLSLLVKATSNNKSAFALARKPLRLVVDEVDEQDPADIAYVFSGYAPLSVRLVQCALGRAGAPSVNGWKGIEEVLKGLDGVSFEMTQQADPSSHSQGKSLR